MNTTQSDTIYPREGIVTWATWLMMADGQTYLHAYSDEWQIATDAAVGESLGTKFRSTEKWALVAWRDGKVVAVIPGCQVKGFVACSAPSTPTGSGIFNLKTGARHVA
jgi:hypothetical protein